MNALIKILVLSVSIGIFGISSALACGEESSAKVDSIKQTASSSTSSEQPIIKADQADGSEKVAK